jgi:predicted transcriptional regulator
MDEFPCNLMVVRLKMGLTRKELTSKIKGVNEGRVARIESGYYFDPRVYAIEQLLKITGIESSDMIQRRYDFSKDMMELHKNNVG